MTCSRCYSWLIWSLAIGFGAVPCLQAAERRTPVDFNRDIRPILSKNCFACHGPDPAHRATKMRLDRRETIIKRQKSGATPIVPGKPEQSELIRRVSSRDADYHMPPPETGIQLTREQIDVLKRWIGEGATYAEHWAFVKPAHPLLPAVRNTSWPRNAIDSFVLARLEREGLHPAPEADRLTLLRRVSLDLRGLPPSRDEIDAFDKDTAPGAYERVVDRFLADPAYGERWARVWLDLARYADSAGYGSDPLRPNIWPYRDWVINAFNRNLPFNEFTIEQLAGDLLPNATQSQRIATAFHRNTMTNTEGGTDREEFRVAAVKDRIDTTMQVWMGLTMGCAKCHSHKYDPISQEDYYRFFAIFNQTADADRSDEQPTLPLPTAAQAEQIRRVESEIALLRRRLLKPELIASWSIARSIVPPGEALQALAAIRKLEKARPKPVDLPVMVELPSAKRRSTYVMIKGNFMDHGAAVDPGLPAAFAAKSSPAAPNRLTVARWLVSPDNPLTARVAVNRFWARLWGVGIVETEEDFGTQGELPSHPKLLDWLATEYMRLGWDTKALLRLMVTSATYRQSSRVTAEAATSDPHNRLLARGPRIRLEAEMVRDQALAFSGLLSRRIQGPSVFPPQPNGLWQAAFNGQRTWPTSQGENRHRRGLYTFWRRTIPYPSMTTFDAPSRELCTCRRVRTNTPLQALVTLNDPVYVEAAQALARRIMHEAGPTVQDRARFGLHLCLVRQPQEEEINRLVQLFAAALEHYRSDPKAARAMVPTLTGQSSSTLPADELAAWTIIANVLLNLDGVLTKT